MEFESDNRESVLIEYVENLISRLKNGDASIREKRIMTEMMLKCEMTKDMEVDKYTDEDFVKFISMGWYVYSMLDEKTPFNKAS